MVSVKISLSNKIKNVSEVLSATRVISRSLDAEEGRYVDENQDSDEEENDDDVNVSGNDEAAGEEDQDLDAQTSIHGNLL